MADFDISEILRNTDMGTLNENSFERFGIMKDEFNYQDLSSVREAISEIYKQALDKTPKGPYKAIVLHATQDPIGDDPGRTFITGKYGISKAGYVTKVVARIEEIHAFIPKPISTGVGRLDCDVTKNLAILLHPIFYAITAKQSPLPEPGNVVSVDFVDASDKSYGEYLGMVEDQVRGTPCGQVSAKAVADGGNEDRLG